MKLEPEQIWQEYQKIQEYLTQKNLFNIVKTNEKFYDGEQWGDLSEKNDMPKPVINVLQRVVKYMVATLSTNEVAVSITPFSESKDDLDKIKPIAKEIEKVIETAKIKEASKLAIRNGAVDGSAYMLQLFDHSFDTGQDVKGRIVNKLIDNTNIYFGNPYSNDIQTQPWIIVAFRQHVGQVREEAKALGVKEIDDIKADTDTNQANDDSDELCTVLIKYYKKNGEVWFTKTTQNVVLKKPELLGYKRYPISCFGWDPVKNSYLYNSPLTAVIPNQVFINKCYAIAQMYGLQSAFPKIVYDKNKVHIDELLNKTGAHAVSGLDMMGKFLDFIKIPDFSNNILALLENTIEQTKECMGVTDAALGNVNPDNTSAIIALQESSNMPLEIQRQEFYEFWEDTVRNILEVMAHHYGERQVITEVDGEKTLAKVDFSILQNLNFEVNVDIGNASQFSEVAQINTLDKLFQAQIIDAKTYVDSVPSKYMPNKGKIQQYLAKKAEEEQLLQEQMMLQQQQGVTM